MPISIVAKWPLVWSAINAYRGTNTWLGTPAYPFPTMYGTKPETEQGAQITATNKLGTCNIPPSSSGVSSSALVVCGSVLVLGKLTGSIALWCATAVRVARDARFRLADFRGAWPSSNSKSSSAGFRSPSVAAIWTYINCGICQEVVVIWAPKGRRMTFTAEKISTKNEWWDYRRHFIRF